MGNEEEKLPIERQIAYEKEHAAILKKHELGFGHVIDFPFSRRVPILSRIALKIVSIQGGRISTRYVDLKK